MQIIPEHHKERGVTELPITVEESDEGGDVLLSFEVGAHETQNDAPFWRQLTVEEALELAAALRHVAREQRRRWRR